MICEKCKTENGYIRFETKEWVCRKCGTISPVTIKEKVEQKPDDEVIVQDEKKEAAADMAKDDTYIKKEE